MKRGGVLILAAVLIISILFVSGCAPSNEDITKNPQAVMDGCNKSSLDKQVDCYWKIAEVLRKNNPEAASEACSAMPPKESEAKNNMQKGCFDELIRAQEPNSSDLRFHICQKISRDDWKKECIEGAAGEEKDPQKVIEMCNAVNDSNFRNHCYGIIANSQNTDIDTQLIMCDVRVGRDKDNCYRGLADGFVETNASKSIEICNKILGKSDRDACLGNFLSNPELVKADPSLAISTCDSLTLKSRCYNDVARTLSAIDPKRAAGVCQRLDDDVQISDCYGNVWFTFNDLVVQNYDFTVGLCNILTLKKDDCLRRISGAFMDIDRSKAEAACKLMSASNSGGCLQSIQR